MVNRILILVILGFSFGCGDTTAVESSRGRSQTYPGMQASTFIEANSLAIVVLAEMHRNLQSRAKLSSDQATLITNKAVGQLEIHKSSLLWTVLSTTQSYEDSLEVFVDELIAGALDALDELGEVNQRRINRILTEIVASVFESMQGRTDHLQETELVEMMRDVSKAAVESLEMAGFSDLTLAEGGRTLLAAAVAALDDADILTEANSEAILIAIVEGSMLGLAELGRNNPEIGLATYDLVLDDLMYGAVGSLDDAGLPTESIDEHCEHLIEAAIGSLDHLGLSVEEMIEVLDSVMIGALDGLKREAGITSAEQLEQAIGYMIKGAVEGLVLSGVSMTEADAVIVELLSQTVSYLDNLSVDGEQVETAIEAILFQAASGLDDIGFTDQHLEEYGDILADMMVAIAAALIADGYDNTEVERLLDDMIEVSIAVLPGHKINATDAETITSHLRNTLSLGLNQESLAGLDQGEIESHIERALQAAYGL